jgi:hypothetical protein
LQPVGELNKQNSIAGERGAIIGATTGQMLRS